MARNPKVELRGHEGQVVHPITDGDCVIFPSGETLSHKLSEQEEVMYAPEVTNSSPMFKVGEGDSSDYSANVLDGAYQEAVLKGQTYVNTIQEPSADVITLPTPFTEYERTQSKTFTEMQDGTFGLNLVGQSYVNCIQEPSEPSYVALGENLEFQNKKVEYTTDGQIKSAMLNGMTLVNLWNNNGEYNIAPNNSIEQKGNCFKKSTKYLLKYNVLQTNTNNSMIVQYYQNGTWVVNELSYAKLNEDYYILTTPSVDFNKIRIFYNSTFGTETVILEDIMLIEYQEGMENWDIPYFEGIQSVTMTTELENVCSRYNSSVAKNGKTFTVGTSNSRRLDLSTASNILNYNFKPSTKYLMQFKISNLNLDGMSSLKLIFSDDVISSGNCLFGEKSDVTITQNGIYRTILTTTNLVSTSTFVIKGYVSEWENSTSTTRKLTISQVMCIEYQNGMENWDLPYFETTQLMKPLKIQSANKNLFDMKNVYTEYNGASCSIQGNEITINSNGNYQYPNIQYSLDKKLYCDKTIFVSYEVIQNTSSNWHMQFIYTDKTTGQTVYLNARLGKVEMPNKEDVKGSIKLGLYPDNTAKTGTAHTLKLSNIQLEEVESAATSATDYVPHQSKTMSALEPITLRAIGDVKDTLDLSTGEYVQRIGEVVFDGSDDEGWYADGNVIDDTSILFRIIISNAQEEDSINLLCDKFKSKFCYPKNTGEAIYISFIKELTIRINKDKLSENSVNGFIAYLKQNPIKVQYLLANPITRKISLEYPNLQTYQDITHVQSIAMDGTLIPKIFLPSDIPYRAMLKPSTSYNVIVDREVIDSTNQLTVNLGGTTANITANRTVVTTPSTLSNETLTFSGKDNRLAKAMLIEGSTLINGDLPHFDGIGDVKLGRVVENLCMANEILVGSSTATLTSYMDRIELKVTKEGSCVEKFKLTKQLQNSKKYFIYCPYSINSPSAIPSSVIAFEETYNGSIIYTRESKDIQTDGKYILTLEQQVNPYEALTIGNHSVIPVNTTMTIRRPILCEYVDGMENWDWESIGYFTGTRNVGNEFMRIGNKNLFVSNNLILGANQYWASEEYIINAGHTLRATLSQLIQVTPGCTLTLTFGSNYQGVIQEYISDDKRTHYMDGGWHDNTQTLILDEKTKYVNVYFRKIDDTQFTTDELNALKNSIQLEEASSATSYVAHKHNSLHILPDKQIPLTFEQGRIDYTNNGTWANAINNTSTQVIRTQLLDLEPNETYRVSCGHSDFMFAVGLYNNSLLGSSVISYTSDRERYFTTTKDVHKIGIATMRKDSTNIAPSVLHQVRLEKVTDVHLRSVGNVKDELDLTRGVYIQRIGEKILDGSYGISRVSNKDTCTIIQYNVEDKKQGSNYNPISNKFNRGDWDSRIPYEVYCGNIYDMFFVVPLSLNITTIDEAKAWFKNNNVIAQYELATPIEHKINIPMKNESNQTIAKPNGVFTLPLMYSETNYVDINSQIYPKVQSRDYISYPVIANNSQLHTIFHNKLGTGNLTVNLCGTSVTSVDGTSKCTITTPSTISQYELRLSGANNKVSNVCVFSGDYMNVNVPYVEGMMNAVNPIVKNVGKNLFDGVVKNGEGWWNGKADPVTKFRRSVNLTPVKPNTEYSYKLANGRGVNFMAHGKDGKFLKYIAWFTSNITKFTTPSDCYYIHWYNDIDDFTDFYIEEASTPSQYEPYKENICEPKNGVIELTEDMFEQGTFNTTVTNVDYESRKENQTTRIRTKGLIPIKPNMTYSISVNKGYAIFIGGYDKNQKCLGSASSYTWANGRTFTATSDCHYICIAIRTDNNKNITPSDFNNVGIIVQKLEDIITLRSLPNGVRDELNLQTGEYIQRIGEIVLDGSDDEDWYYTDTDTSDSGAPRFSTKIIDRKYYSNNIIVCDKYKVVSFSNLWNGTEDNCIGAWGSGVHINVRDTQYTSVADFKTSLQQNLIKVQYELETPIIKQIDINNFPHSYKDGHVIIESNDPSTNVTAQITYQCVANRTGQIQEHTEQIEKQEHEINELEMLILENIRQQQNR